MPDFDIIVIGGGHAGVEAALAVSRMGRTAALVTLDAGKLALMSCNPAIGGIGKSQLVKEIDVLGGIMGEAIDATGIQFRRLNLSRGPAVWSTRVQADRIKYNQFVVDFVAADPRVEVIEAAAGALVVENGEVVGILTEQGESISCRGVVVATGTFLGGLIHIGEKKIRAGRRGESAAWKLSESLLGLGFEVSRLKTGTPPRLDGNSIDFSKCTEQPGESPIPYFSHRSTPRDFDQSSCFLTKTTLETRQIISESSKLSPIFSGQISSTGPRYCPSIEDKYFRFPDKLTHQIFLEPEGNGTDEIYPNGFSTALPEEIQYQAIRTVVGLEDAVITQPGYAVEYDYCPAHQITNSLETHRVKGLFFAGQINGTSGYEEAGAQGLVAGVNAVCRIENRAPLVLDRSTAYIGVMIDDLATRSTTEPYRMFTSRAEYRLALREDNARDRLSAVALKYGLIPDSEHEQYLSLEHATEQAVESFGSSRVALSALPEEIAGKFKRRDSLSLAELLKQPGIDLDWLKGNLNGNLQLPDHADEALARAAVRIRYEGYIAKQEREIEKFRKLEREAIPDGFSYDSVPGLRNEAREKFRRFSPESIGQAGRIEGITAGDVAVLSVFVKRHKEARNA